MQGDPWLVLIRIVMIVLKQHKFGKDACFLLLLLVCGGFLWGLGVLGGWFGLLFVCLFLLRELSLDASEVTRVK